MLVLHQAPKWWHPENIEEWSAGTLGVAYLVVLVGSSLALGRVRRPRVGFVSALGRPHKEVAVFAVFS